MAAAPHDSSLLAARISQLENEKEIHLQDIQRLVAKIRELEEENDLLALENDQWRQKYPGGPAAAAATLVPATTTTTPAALDDDEPPPPVPSIGLFKLAPDNSYLEEGDGRTLPTTEALVLDGVSGLNPLCVRLFSCPSSSSSSSVYAAVGGVDKFLSLFRLDLSDGSSHRLTMVNLESPLLSLEVAPFSNDTKTILLITCMDGSHALLSIDPALPADAFLHYKRKDHAKHAVVGKWSRCGRFYATGGHDKAVHIYSFSPEGEEEREGGGGGEGEGGEGGGGEEGGEGGGKAPLKSFFFAGNVEAMVFVERPPLEEGGGGGGRGDRGGKVPWLVVASRNVPYLAYIECTPSFTKHTVSLNHSAWDEHVSFAALSMAVSPCQEFLLVATGTSLSTHPPTDKE